MKRTILHIIDSLELGGAELLLAGVINSLKDYRNIVVYFKESNNDLKNKINYDQLTFIKYSGKKSILACALKLRKKINKEKPNIIHSHLYWSTIITRLALIGKNIKLFTTYHNCYYDLGYKNIFLNKLLDKLTYNRKQVIIHVSRSQQIKIDKQIGIKKSYVLYNYINDIFFNTNFSYIPNRNGLRIVTIANLKTEKNQGMAIEAISELKQKISKYDIYGEGPLKAHLTEKIVSHNMGDTIELKGQAQNIQDILIQYDLFLLASTHEGFGIAVVEAMAIGIPLLLSDIDVFKEITEGNALFIHKNSKSDLKQKLEDIINKQYNLTEMSALLKKTAQKYNRNSYIKSLLDIYTTESKD
jgi:glycosyltransferase involved in cell wall biosynthesis